MGDVLRPRRKAYARGAGIYKRILVAGINRTHAKKLRASWRLREARARATYGKEGWLTASGTGNRTRA